MYNIFSIRFFREATYGVARWMAVFSLLLIPLVGHAQCTDRTTQGKDFWLMFLTNYHGQTECSLMAACPVGTTIRVSNPSTGWGTIVYSTTGGNVRINIPINSATTSLEAEVSGGGIHVTANRPISLYASNFFEYTFDIATIYPTSTLRTRYITQTYGESSDHEVGFVAVEDSTILSMEIPSFIFSPPIPAGHHSVMLMQGQTYQLHGVNLSGMEVTSNGKPFAMFQGNICTFVGNCGACDHLYEQSYPIDYWGNVFMLVSTETRVSGDLVLITSAQDSCSLYLDNNLIGTIQAGETFSYELPTNTAKLLRSTEPVTVCVYLKGISCGNPNGDPAAVILPPVEQGVKSTVFQAVNTETTTEHYANIVAPNYAVPYMKLDGTSIASRFTRTLNGYAYSRLSVSPGTHTLSSDFGTFVAYFYGLGYAESYAYIAGSSIIDLSEKLYVDGHYTRSYTESLDYCQGDTIPMWIESDEEDLITVWFVDSLWAAATDTGIFNCVFDTPGDHLVEAVVHFCDTLSALIHVMPTYLETTADSLCFDRSYSWGGRELDSTGTYYDTLLSSQNCDSVLALDLTVVPRPVVTLYGDVDCHEAVYTLTADLHEVEGTPFTWSSTPYDPLLVGHEHDTVVNIYPLAPTLYTLNLAYLCPFSESITLASAEWPGAAWVINPGSLSYEHLWFDAYDRSRNVSSRQWFVNQLLQGETGDHLRYYALADDDSLEVMLVVNSGTCRDTLLRVIPVSHAAQWAPNVFTPDAETNNLFSVTLNEGVAEELYIYNRNGLLVSYIAGPNPVWDGTRDGTPCPQSAYVWLLRYHTDDRPDQHKVLTGTITLLR